MFYSIPTRFRIKFHIQGLHLFDALVTLLFTFATFLSKFSFANSSDGNKTTYATSVDLYISWNWIRIVRYIYYIYGIDFIKRPDRKHQIVRANLLLARRFLLLKRDKKKERKKVRKERKNENRIRYMQQRKHTGSKLSFSMRWSLNVSN